MVARNAPLDVLTYVKDRELRTFPVTVGSGFDPKTRQATIHLRHANGVQVPVFGQPEENLRDALENRPQAVIQPILDTGHRPVLCYPRAGEEMDVFKPGDYGFMLSCIQNLGVVDEDALTWEQVADFREDGASRAELIRFHYWLSTVMKMKSKAEIEDELSLLYEKRQSAFRKFGIVMRMVGDSVVALPEQSWNRLLTSCVGVGAGLAWEPLVAVLVAGVSLGGSVIAQLRRTSAELKAEGDATAFIHGLVERFGTVEP